MRRLLACVLALALCFTLTACWENESTETPDFWEVEPETPAEPEPVVKASIFTLPYLNNQTLDPVACSDGVQQVVGSLIYEGLFSLDAQFSPQPMLCSSYSRSTNGLTYTFTLRDGATFSNGTALTATDVLATYRRAQVSERYAARFANVVSMRVNRGAFLITLKQPDSAFPALLDIPIVKSGTEKDTVPLGTGPYFFLTDTDGPCLMRSECWWRDAELPFERIGLAPAKNVDTAVYLFSAEQAHLLMADLLGETSASALSGADMADAPTTSMLFLGFNTKNPALADAALRVSLGEALDREAAVTTLLAGHAQAAEYPISPRSPLYPDAQEPNEAAIESGPLEAEPEEQPPLELTLLVNEENSFKTALADHLAKQLSVAPVTVTPVVLPWSEYTAALESGGFDLWLGEVRLTADWNVTQLVGTGGALNYGGYSNPALDKALAAFLANEDETTAAAFYTLLAAESPILPVAFKSVSVLTPEGVIDGVAPTAARPLAGIEQWSFHLPEA